MNNNQARQRAVELATSRRPVKFARKNAQSDKVSHHYGKLCFSLKKMKERVPHEIFQEYKKALKNGKKITSTLADAIAVSVKEWCKEEGVSHFTHWFQPMTGSSAEKHDSFLDFDPQGMAIEKFNGKMLIKGEPDASSFPSGGMRETHEARGYTVWNPSSPMFIIESENGKTLYIPSLFIGHHGEVLDEKTSLLRSHQTLEKEVKELLHILDIKAEKVVESLGAEQEYFLIDTAYYVLRPDLYMTGRTLFGDHSAKGQQLSDHYFASIPDRVLAFMNELEHTCFELGIPLTTRHNEVAPTQFETAPVFENLEIACDHNLLLMTLLKRIAKKHNFEALLHEKPFAGINGSGKHCNWSLRTTGKEGKNLLDPGDNPQQNKTFLLMLVSILKGVHEFRDLLRAAIASAGSDHRLGANEAPPAIISVFLGETLNKVLDTLENAETVDDFEQKILDLGISEIPDIFQEPTDRNRTSPFAFTGNKFEFRAVGGEAQIAFPMTILNAVVAYGVRDIRSKLQEKLELNNNPGEAVNEVLREKIAETKNIRFEGNNYSDEWKTEAQQRGLSHKRKAPEALGALKDENVIKMLTDLKIFTEKEIQSRYNVLLEKYNEKMFIEVESLSFLLDGHIIPSACEAQKKFAESVVVAEKAGLDVPQKQRAEKITKSLGDLLENREEFVRCIKELMQMEDQEEKSKFLAGTISSRMENLVKLSNKIEAMVPDALWSLPKYSEMIFLY